MSSIQNSPPHPPFETSQLWYRGTLKGGKTRGNFFSSFMAIFNSQFPNGINKHLNFKNLTWSFYILSIVAMFLSSSLHKWLLMVHLGQKWVHMPLGSEMCMLEFLEVPGKYSGSRCYSGLGTQGTSPDWEPPDEFTGTGSKSENLLLAKGPNKMGQWGNGC